MIIEMPKGVGFALQRLNDAGYQAVIVGGCVRDALLGKTPKDYDIATSATPDEMKRAFFDCRLFETGIQHGTLTLIFDHQPIEITTYRVDGDYSDGRRPDHVAFTRELSRDLTRRDFTINAMAYAPQIGVIDEVGGMGDLTDRIIRCVGQPDRRFAEDALRILRALRFAAQLGFSLEKETEDSLIRMRHTLDRISRERIWVEFSNLLMGGYAYHVLTRFRTVIEAFLPGLCSVSGEEYRHACEALAILPDRLAIRLAVLLAPLGAEGAHTALKNLRTDVHTTRSTCALIAALEADTDDMSQKRLLGALGREAYGDALSLRLTRGADTEVIEQARAKADEWIAQGTCISPTQLAVNGRDLMLAGVEPGRQMGETLKKLFEDVLSDRLPNEREALLDAIRKPL